SGSCDAAEYCTGAAQCGSDATSCDDIPAFRAGRPFAWEDDSFFTGTGDWDIAPGGNLQVRTFLFAWSPAGVGAKVRGLLYYNSADAGTNRGLGNGFRLGVAATLSVGADGSITIEEPDGTPRRFTTIEGVGYRAAT